MIYATLVTLTTTAKCFKQATKISEILWKYFNIFQKNRSSKHKKITEKCKQLIWKPVIN